MTLARMKLAVEGLLAFTSPPMRTTYLSQPNKTIVEELVRLADCFVCELEDAGQLDELTIRADRFLKVTGEGSAFDNSRKVVHQALAAYQKEGGFPICPIGMKRFPLTPEELRTSLEGSALAKITAGVASRENIRWNLSQAAKDAEGSLHLNLSTLQESGSLAGWEKSLRDVTRATDREHLFGCYLLALCGGVRVLEGQQHVADVGGTLARQEHHEAQSVQAAEAGHAPDGAEAGVVQQTGLLAATRLDLSLFQLLAVDLRRYASTIQEAAKYLFADAEDRSTTKSDVAPPAEAISSSDRPSPVGEKESLNAKIPDWAHSPKEPRPEEYKFGSLRGNNAILAEAICPVFKKKVDIRGIQRRGKRGELWIVWKSAQDLEVYFKDQPTYAACNAKSLEIEMRKEEDKSRKKQEQDN